MGSKEMAITTEKQWQEESDARTLSEAKIIKADKKRRDGAKRGAKRVLVEEQRRLKQNQQMIKDMKKIVKPLKPKKKKVVKKSKPVKKKKK